MGGFFLIFFIALMQKRNKKNQGKRCFAVCLGALIVEGYRLKSFLRAV
jgi:hypothetical protein